MKWVRLTVIWLFSILIALVMIQQGLPKFSPDGRWTRSFAEWGYAPWFRILVGLVEVAGGALLLIPPLAFYAAIALIAVMLGAFVTLAMDGRAIDAITPIVYALVLTWIAIRRREGRFNPRTKPASDAA